MRKITIEVPDNIADDLVEKYSKKKAWKPKKGESYYTINYRACVVYLIWNDDPIDEGAYAIGNVYRTKPEAEQALEKMKALATIRRHAEQFDFSPNWSDRSLGKYYVFYDHTTGKLEWGYSTTNHRYLTTYYPTGEAAEQAISEVGDAYLTLFGVKS